MTDEIASFKVTAADIQKQEVHPSGDAHMQDSSHFVLLILNLRSMSISRLKFNILFYIFKNMYDLLVQRHSMQYMSALILIKYFMTYCFNPTLQ